MWQSGMERESEMAYEAFAEVYEELMDNVPYDAWCDRIRELLLEAGIPDGLVAELGCGTGSMTRRLAGAGYDMIGIDLSPDMLDAAREADLREGGTAPEKNDAASILYLNQDMRSFELYGTVRAIVSVCDSINYILEPDEVQEVFRLVNNYLDPKGMLILDFHTPYYFREVLGDSSIAETREEMAMIWENEESDDGIHRLYLTVFREEPDGRYQRFEELHQQRGYTTEEMRSLAEAAGLVDVQFYDEYTKEAATERSERVVMTARECGKEEQYE